MSQVPSRGGHGGSGGGCGLVKLAVGLRVEAAADELSLDVCVPVVFDLVVGSSRQSARNQ